MKVANKLRQQRRTCEIKFTIKIYTRMGIGDNDDNDDNDDQVYCIDSRIESIKI